MAKIHDLEEIEEADSYSAISGLVSLPEQYMVRSDYDTQSVTDSIISTTESLGWPEVGSDDLHYQSIEQLER